MMKLTTIQIRDLGRTVTGHTPPTKETKYYGNYMPFVKPTDIDKDTKYTYEPEQYYSEEAAEKYKSSLIPKGSTCVVCIGTIGEKMTMAHCDMFTNQSINSIIPSEDYDKDYVYYLLKYNLGKVKSLNKGTASGREFVSKSTFLDMNIRVYKDKHMQEKIGKILSYYDNLIENYHRQIKLLEEAAQRLYKEWFVDLHFPGHDNVKVIDGVPEGWLSYNIDDVFDIKYGKNLSTKEIAPTGKYPVYGANGIIGYYDKYNCDEPVVLITSRGNGSGDVLKTYERYTFVTNNSFIVKAKVDFPYCMLPFTFGLMRSVNFRSIRTGAAQPQLTNASIHLMNITLPTSDLIKKYCDTMEPNFKLVRHLRNQLTLLTESRDRLLPKLMSGEI